MKWPSVGGEIIPVKNASIEKIEPNYGLLVAEINGIFDDKLTDTRNAMDRDLLDDTRKEINKVFRKAFMTITIYKEGQKFKIPDNAIIYGGVKCPGW